MDIEDIIKETLEATICVKLKLGAGFLERVYQNALIHELKLRGLHAEKEVPISVYYKGVIVGDYRADILVENQLLIETKMAEALTKAHECQLANYLQATGLDTGLLINFGTMRSDVRRKFRLPKSATANPDLCD